MNKKRSNCVIVLVNKSAAVCVMQTAHLPLYQSTPLKILLGERYYTPVFESCNTYLVEFLKKFQSCTKCLFDIT